MTGVEVVEPTGAVFVEFVTFAGTVGGVLNPNGLYK